jgi:hypothetical protein
MYFDISVKALDLTWGFQQAGLYATELINSPEYTKKVNDKIDKYDNVEQVYPNGTTFDYHSSSYF